MQAMARTRAVNGNFKPNDDYEKMQFYYHPDHLGSSSYITNLDGEVSQHIEYVPFGEVFIEERNNTWNTPYLFNAKEFDEETGMYYYGARYYEPRLSLWMSVDRFAENYPNIASYCFSANNPLHIVDENGDSIQIREFGQETKMWNVYNYDVESGSFKDANGTKYSGTNENIARTTSALNVLRSKKAGNDLVTKLSQSSKKVIILAQEGTSNGEGEGSQGYDSYVKWDPTKDAAFGGGSFVALGHELAHSLDRLSGTMDNTEWYSDQLPDGNVKSVPNAEKYSTHYENLIRAEHNLGLRTHYSIDEYGNPSGGVIIQSNKSLYFNYEGGHAIGYSKIKEQDRYKYK